MHRDPGREGPLLVYAAAIPGIALAECGVDPFQRRQRGFP
jgi:hypothetical protein